MTPTVKTEEKGNKSQKNRQKWLEIEFLYPLADPDFKFSQGNNCTHMQEDTLN